MSRRIKHSAIWLVPLFIVVMSLIYHLFVYFITPSVDRGFDYGTTPFVPAESRHSSGTDSR